MNQPEDQRYLKLTAYFGERQYAESGPFLADALLDLFGARDVAASVMLRGIAGFGPRHVLRSDESLSLSENPPVAIAAVDVEPKMSTLVNDVLSMTGHGLVTLERAQLLYSGVDAGGIQAGSTAKLTVYIGRQQRIAGIPAYFAICERLYRNGFAGAIALLGVDGTAHGQRYRARFFSRNVDVPLMIIATGTSAQVSSAATELSALVPKAPVSIEAVQLCKRDGELFTAPQLLPSMNDPGRTLWQKLMVQTSESARHDGLPIHRGLIHRLLRSKAALGATVLRGLWGFHGNHEPHGDKLFQISRQVPVTTVIIGEPESIAASFEIVDELTTKHGLVTSEVVPAAWVVHHD